jgi:hypothetical protein
MAHQERTAPPMRIDPATVNGWGADADRDNDPTYPMRRRGPEETPGLTWDRPPLQEPRVEILRSIEHNRLPAALGTSVPPSGVSGAVRRFAFRYSESQWAHWLLLILADRINVVEGLVDDLRGGRAPNLWTETGMPAELRHDRKGLAVAALVGVGVIAAVVLVSRLHDRD